MKDSTLRIINIMNTLSDALENKTKSYEESINLFRKQISLSQLKECLTDPGLDDTDIAACKMMLKLMYNYEFDLN